ncbi:uncharacterized protein LOC143879328 isoform X2 [Tasmannia lanceolata]|uniref:uncharacterized protein LOC143879328 isoform X2 n=1 Tax=Tasmannia lanceolata TaxID=3420 RepID=UPI004062A52F
MEFPCSALLLLLLLLLANFYPKPASSELVLEYGYTVTTVLDGDKLQIPIHPFSVLPRARTQDLLLLDSVNSNFYIVSFPISPDSGISRFSGNGTGLSDGRPLAAMFHHPRSFAVDSKGTLYVADRNNHAIRKISSSGVTTIAGGFSKKPGRSDGPAQNASFSDDFDLVFVPKICALLISDRGNRLVRQMNLKPEDCERESRLELGVPLVSVIGVLCLLVGLLSGFAVRPFLISHDASGGHSFDKMWKHCQTILGKRVLTICSDIKSAIASSTPYIGRIVSLTLSNLSLMLEFIKQKTAMERWMM